MDSTTFFLGSILVGLSVDFVLATLFFGTKGGYYDSDDCDDNGTAPGLIQSLSQGFLPGLRAWVEVGGIAPSQCPTALLPQPIST